jgi:outer membrane protein TolC
MRFHWLQILQPEPNTYCLKERAVTGIPKKSIEANYYPSLSLTGGTSLVKVLRCLGSRNHLMEFIGLTLHQLGSILRIPIFSGFGTKARVSQADNKLVYKK